MTANGTSDTRAINPIFPGLCGIATRSDEIHRTFYVYVGRVGACLSRPRSKEESDLSLTQTVCWSLKLLFLRRKKRLLARSQGINAGSPSLGAVSLLSPVSCRANLVSPNAQIVGPGTTRQSRGVYPGMMNPQYKKGFHPSLFFGVPPDHPVSSVRMFKKQVSFLETWTCFVLRVRPRVAQHWANSHTRQTTRAPLPTTYSSDKACCWERGT